jgi:superfamily II DNA or RNA helicase
VKDPREIELPPSIERKDYQIDALCGVAKKWEAGCQGVMLCLPTGTGKTITSGLISKYMIEEFGRGVLFIAHRTELIEQATNTYVNAFGFSTAIEMGGQSEREFVRSHGKEPEVVVASVQSLYDERLAGSFRPDRFGLIIIDEAHHAAAASYKSVLGHFQDYYLLGLTATPDGATGSLSQVFGSVGYQMRLRSAIEDGHLVPVKIRRIEVPVDLRHIRTTGGDYNLGDLAERLSPAIEKLAYQIHANVGDRQTVVFTPDVGSAHMVADMLVAMGRKAEYVAGAAGKFGITKDVRKQRLARYKAMETQVIVSCDLLVEGWDNPATSCVVIARPTKKRYKACQMVGRGTRLCTSAGKTDCIAEGQRVLTDRGLVPIENVTTAMRVWDGCEFVSHSGAICKGKQEVISYARLTATPDHKVWTRHGWRTFRECQEKELGIAVAGIGGTPIRESENRFYGDRQESEADDLDGMHPLQGGETEATPLDRARAGRMHQMLPPDTVSEMALQEGHVRPAEVLQSERIVVPAVRRQRDRIPVFFGLGDVPMGSIDPWFAQEHGDRPDRQQRPLRAGQPEIRDQIAKHFKHEEKEGELEDTRVQGPSSGSSVLGLHAEATGGTRPNGRGDRGEIQQPFVQAERRVWDILNAGPRHRFTVEGLLVSNCLVLDLDWQQDDSSRELDIPAMLFSEGFSKDALDILNDRTRVHRERKADERNQDIDILRELREIEWDLHQARVISVNYTGKHTEIYAHTDNSPFGVGKVLDIGVRKGKDFDPYRCGPATPFQVARLKKLGVDGAEKMNLYGASRLLGKLESREKKGLASHQQVKELLAKGVNEEQARTVSRKDAASIIAQNVLKQGEFF